MKTPRRQSRLTGWIGRCAFALVALTLCASAIAGDGGKNVVAAAAPRTETPIVRSVPKKQLYMFTSASAIPQPIDRVASPIVTTAIPVTVFKGGW